MQYFVLVYNQAQGELEEHRVYDEADLLAALSDRRSTEERLVSRDDIEVVILGAESEDHLRSTHARYFKSADQMFA